MPLDGISQPWLWGYFLPIGLLLLTWGGLPPHKARRVTPVAALALALAVIGYWAVGFAFHLGGAQAVRPDDPTLSGLKVLFPLVPRNVGWGFLGLSGFFLSGPDITPAVLELFLAYLPLMAAAVLLVTLALTDTRRWVMVIAGLLAGTLVFPVAACWMWGGGWLAHLGDTLGLGHGFVDFGGSALVLWLPGTLALGILLFQPRQAPEDPPAPPPAYFPLLANLGVLLMGIGWIGWILSAPFHTGTATWDWNRAAFSALLGMAGATLTSQLYAWLATGELESLLAARGLAAGWGAALAAAPFVPPWAALVIGLLGGLLFSFIMYLTNVVMRLRDAAATVALGLVGGLWGLLGVALFADGRAGQGWNGITSTVGTGGVRGVFFGGAGQLTAQLVGIVAVGVWGLFWGVLLGVISNPRMFRRKPVPVGDAGISSDAVLLPEVLPPPSDVLSVKTDELVPPEVISAAGGQVPAPIVDEDPVVEPEESPVA